jgi:hypothetical protein
MLPGDNDRPQLAPDGQLEQHTRAAGAGDDQAPELGGGDPVDLLAGSPDLAATDVLAVAAELVAAPRRERGRPPGAGNRKNGDMIAYLQALGHRDPWVTLSLIQSADFKQLCKMVGATSSKAKVQVLQIQSKAADSLMNYHHSKRPQQLDLLPPGDKRPLMVIGEMNVSIVGESGFMSAGEPPRKVKEINGEAVRETGDVSHDKAK